MNLVGHDMVLIEELKKYMLKRIELYNRKGFIKKNKYDELVDFETKALNERLETMKQWL
ncbi:hypothetical protein [Paenibacillus spiritus]|uniref:hypothetical protein n=1 Tax=Paenibacillus spiritus TaxID=2496557 RepID=UPI00168B3230|nr:hypothetical protein [Paenibacillus spiritus]